MEPCGASPRDGALEPCGAISPGVGCWSRVEPSVIACSGNFQSHTVGHEHTEKREVKRICYAMAESVSDVVNEDIHFG